MIIQFIISVLLTAASFLQIDKQNLTEVYIPVDGTKLFCRTMGKGTPLIVLHGGPGLTQDYLLPQMEKLAEGNFVIFYDQRGCGRSHGEISEETINLSMYVEDLDAIRKAFKYETISILGHSWGGFLAMEYAIAHPENVEKLILSNSMSASSDELTLFIDEYMRRMGPYWEELTTLENSAGHREGDPSTIEKIHRLLYHQYCHDPEKADLLNIRMTSEAAINGCKVFEIIRQTVYEKPYNLHKSLRNLNIPTLIIHGDFDPIPHATACNLHMSILNSKYVLMENCGHFPFVEDPNVYFKFIDEFLNEGK